MEKVKKEDKVIHFDESYEGNIKALKELLGLREDQNLDEFTYEENEK